MSDPKNAPWYSRVVWVSAIYIFLSPVAAVWLTYEFLIRYGWSWPQFFAAAIYGGLTCFCITGGYHRYFTHRSYEASPALKWFYLIVGAGALEMSALKWCSDHRRHHRYVDTTDDPYNIRQGFFYAHLGWLLLKDNPKWAGKFEKDLLEDRAVMFQYKVYWPLAIFMTFGVPTLVGAALGSALGGLALGGFVRIVVLQHVTYCINSVCHMFGTAPYGDNTTARDNSIVAMLSMGEGYHNFHHKFQADYRNGCRWYHWDPAKWTVAFLSHFGGTSRLRRTPQPVILTARIEMDQKSFLERGIPLERLTPFRQKLEAACNKLEQLRGDYKARKHAENIRAEIRIAKIEFRSAWKQWRAYRSFKPAAV